MGLGAGVAYSQDGRERSGMGVDSGRLRSGRLAGLVRHQCRPGNVLDYRNNHDLNLRTM